MLTVPSCNTGLPLMSVGCAFSIIFFLLNKYLHLYFPNLGGEGEEKKKKKKGLFRAKEKVTKNIFLSQLPHLWKAALGPCPFTQR